MSMSGWTTARIRAKREHIHVLATLIYTIDTDNLDLSSRSPPKMPLRRVVSLRTDLLLGRLSIVRSGKRHERRAQHP